MPFQCLRINGTLIMMCYFPSRALWLEDEPVWPPILQRNRACHGRWQILVTFGCQAFHFLSTVILANNQTIKAICKDGEYVITNQWKSFNNSSQIFKGITKREIFDRGKKRGGGGVVGRENKNFRLGPIQRNSFTNAQIKAGRAQGRMEPFTLLQKPHLARV